jgi:metal-dependent amidase/aminoacylase/carboxypeptidase family protein
MAKKKQQNRNKKKKNHRNQKAAASSQDPDLDTDTDAADSNRDAFAEFMTNTDKAMTEYQNLTEEERKANGCEDFKKVCDRFIRYDMIQLF